LRENQRTGNISVKEPLKSPRVSVWQADLMLTACAFFWGLGFVGMKSALAVYPTFWILFFRFTGGSLLMGACFRKRIAAAARGDLIGGVVMGVFLFLGMGVQTLGLNFTTAGKQAFITGSYVIMVPLLLWGLRRVFPGWVAIVGSLICFSGIGLLTSDVSGALNVGDVLTTVSALFFACHIISIGYYTKKGDPFVLTFVQFVVAAVLSLCSGAIFDGPLVLKGTKGLMEVAYLIMFPTFGSFLLQNVGQKYTSTTHASIILSLESVFGVLGGIIILNEIFTSRMVLGCCLIFAAILMVELKKE